MTGNLLDRSPAVQLLGSGIFNAAELTIDDGRITGNRPEPQCDGC